MQLVPSAKYYGYFDAIDPIKLEKNFQYKPIAFEVSNYFQPLENFREKRFEEEQWINPDLLSVEKVAQQVLGSRYTIDELMDLENYLSNYSDTPFQNGALSPIYGKGVSERMGV